jgi:DNA-cytosine methyltransferase
MLDWEKALLEFEMLGNEKSNALRVVDLFCGCGGLSAGFDMFTGDCLFDTVLAVDNAPSAIRLFNDNLNRNADGCFPVGRLADVTWFSHPSEIRLYYLSHIAYGKNDPSLIGDLANLGFGDFLAKLKAVDEDYSKSIKNIIDDEAYSIDYGRGASPAAILAIVKGIASKLGIQNFSRPEPSLASVPWTQEYQKIVRSECLPDLHIEPDKQLFTDNEIFWNAQLYRLSESSLKTGRGQNSTNAARVTQLVSSLMSDTGQRIKNCWIKWRSLRDSIRASFCLEHLSSIDTLYASHRVHVVLGGPPCKGFSRIGRPVIDSLRDQGVHAWSHHEFGDERNSLMIQYVLFLRALEPDVFIFENVSNFQSLLKTPNGELDAPQLLEELIENLSLDGLEYRIAHRQMNAKDYGVPQDRRRFIMFGVSRQKVSESLIDEFFSPNSLGSPNSLSAAFLGLGSPAEFSPQNGLKSNHVVSCHDIADDNMSPLLKLYWNWIRQPGPRSSSAPARVDAHVFRKLREDDAALLRFFAPGTRWMDLKTSSLPSVLSIRTLLASSAKLIEDKDILRNINSTLEILDDSFLLRLMVELSSVKFNLSENHLLEQNYLKNGGEGGHGDWFERLSAEKPCKTIVAHIGKDTYGYFHPYERRAITIREAARVQSFPDWFRFGSVGVVDSYTAIGNAVAPLMANGFARKVASIHQKFAIFKDSETVKESGKVSTPDDEQISLAI